MAVVKGMRFVRGKLGDVGFRQQFVKDGKGGYKKQTVAFQLPEGNTSNSVGQARQRSRFRLIQALATMLSQKGLLRALYRSVTGLSGYAAFIGYNVKEAIVESAGDFFVNFPKLRVANGDWSKEIQVFGSDLEPDDDCGFSRKLVWNYETLNDPANAHDYYLVIQGIKVNEEGAVEDTFLEQPLHRMTECMADVILKECDCCKTYYYAYFVNPLTGYVTTSNYIGTADTAVPSLADSDCCFVCDVFENPIRSTPPSEDIAQCCGGIEVDKNNIIFNGTLAHGSRGNVVSDPRFAFVDDGNSNGISCPVNSVLLVHSTTYKGAMSKELTIEETGSLVLSQDGLEIKSEVLSSYADVTALVADLNAKLAAAGSLLIIDGMTAEVDGSIGKTIATMNTTLISADLKIYGIPVIGFADADGTIINENPVSWTSRARRVIWNWASSLTTVGNQTVSNDGIVYTGDDTSITAHQVVLATDFKDDTLPDALTGQLEDVEAECPNQDFAYSFNPDTGLYEGGNI